MQRIAFDLGRPPLVAFNQQTGRDAADRHGGREEHRPAGNQFFRLANIGNDLFGRLTRARRHTGQRDRRTHQLQKGATLNRIGNRFDRRRKFVVQAFLKSRIAGLFL